MAPGRPGPSSGERDLFRASGVAGVTRVFDKYLYALSRGVRGAKQALDQASRPPDPAAVARDVTPAGPLPRRGLAFGPRPLVMGIVNVTPDSFSDGGAYLDPASGVAHGMRLVSEGADILDIGGESTRPGYAPVDAETEIARVAPVIRGLAAATDLPISIDTMKARVAAAALDAGASILNDIWGLQRDPDMARVAGERGVPVVIMHNRASEDASIDIISDALDFLRRSIDIALAAGVALERIIVDPGVGFGKTPEQNLAMVRDLARLRDLGCPVLLGVSRKRIIGAATGRAVARERMAGSLAAAVIGAMGGADIIRVHDVAEHVDAMKVYAAIMNRGHSESDK